MHKNKSTQQLPEYCIPKELEKVLDHPDDDSDLTEESEKYYKLLKSLKNVNYLDLSENHYLQLLKLALYIEEYQSNTELKKHEMSRKRIIQIGSNFPNEVSFKIKVSGLDEEKPWIKPSDSVELTDVSNDATYSLKVINVAYCEIIASDESGKFRKVYKPNNSYDIKFRLQNYSIRCNHYAIENAQEARITTYLFPQKSKPFIRTEHNVHKDLEFYNSAIENNFEQRQAVLNILTKSSFPAPYILYGPPGTGKTATLVEAICQIHKESLNNRILVCTSSNTAADEIARRLLDFLESRYIYRIYGQSRDKSTIDEELKNCSNYNESAMHHVTYNNILGKKILVSTLSTATRIALIKPSVYYFSHIIVDEAGQCTEPDILIPVSIVSKGGEVNSQIVFAGDPKQLGPTVISKIAETILGRSILERLMSYDTYQKGCNNKYNPMYITKLRYNYRSHPSIIHVSNKLFYDNELVSKFHVNSRQKQFPVIFYGVEGTEERSNYSLSTWNATEVSVVLDYVTDLLDGLANLGQVMQQDIGIITPFTLQSQKIKKALRENGLRNITVGTVELFQGQEKKIMIMSTVRSRTFIHEEREHIGFLSNPKRFNVALTRAKNILVVVGNPGVLQQNYMWRCLIEFCIDNGSYYGSPYCAKFSDPNKTDFCRSLQVEPEKIVATNSLFGEDPLHLFTLSKEIPIASEATV